MTSKIACVRETETYIGRKRENLSTLHDLNNASHQTNWITWWKDMDRENKERGNFLRQYQLGACLVADSMWSDRASSRNIGVCLGGDYFGLSCTMHNARCFRGSLTDSAQFQSMDGSLQKEVAKWTEWQLQNNFILKGADRRFLRQSIHTRSGLYLKAYTGKSEFKVNVLSLFWF